MSFSAVLKVCQIVKNKRKIKKRSENDHQCSPKSLMKENERSCRILSPTAPPQPDYCLMMMTLLPDI